MRCKSRLDGIAVDEIDSPPEAIFEEELEVHVRVKRAPSFPELDEDIDIALFTPRSKPSGFSNSALSERRFAPGKRPEDPDPPDAQAPDPFTVFCQHIEDTVGRKHTILL